MNQIIPGDLSSYPDTSQMSLSDLHAQGVYPHIETPKRVMESVYNELKPDGRLYSAESKVTWDKYDFEIHIKVPMIFSEKRTMEVFQEVLDDVIRQMRSESNGGLVY